MLSKTTPKNKIIAILGPTASGKSDLAVKLAKKFDGEIISADSRQVYKGLDIGSGKVPRDKTKSYQLKAKSYFYKGVPHYLLDVASPKKIFTVARYQKLAGQAMKKIIAKNKTPIICGGTGLYIDSLIYQKEFPQIPPQPKLRKKLGKLEAEELFQQLKKLDPQRAQNIDRHNRRRLIRALEIVITIKKPVPPLTPSQDVNFETLIIGIKKSKEELAGLIKNRLEKRLKQGIIGEVKNLRKNGLSWKRLDDLGLEYRYISRYLRGLLTKDEMKELIIKESLKYAKRQMTWFKRNKNTRWIADENEALELAKKFLPH